MPFQPLLPESILQKRYKILHLLRKGGMGAAYLARDEETGMLVVVKELLDSFESQEDRETGIGNFLAEMQVLKALDHPQIPCILDHFVEKRGFFFIMEFVEGEDLTTKLEIEKRLPEEKVIHIGIYVCHVLDYLHNHKPFPILHRDIKSSNIMQRKKDNRIMVLDFGIAKAAKPKEGMMIGTLGYAPPEQHLNQPEPRSDLYALGATLHELATGKRPDSEGFYFDPPNALVPELSQEFSNIVMTALQYNPDDRFESAKAFEEALQSLLPYPLPKIEPDPFWEACRKFSKEFLFPLLTEIKNQHFNACQTLFFPENLHYLSFTLGTQIPHTLMVQAIEEKQKIEFYVKEGILSKTFLGAISPFQKEQWKEVQDWVNLFLSQYEASEGYPMA
jgi:serine/threonine protein kinase